MTSVRGRTARCVCRRSPEARAVKQPSPLSRPSSDQSGRGGPGSSRSGTANTPLPQIAWASLPLRPPCETLRLLALLLDFASGNKRKQNAERRCSLIPPCLSARRAACNPRSPLGVPRRLLPGGCHLPTQLQAMFPGTRQACTLPMDRLPARTVHRSAGVTRGLPVPVQGQHLPPQP
jgi:hypothetical protein